METYTGTTARKTEQVIGPKTENEKMVLRAYELAEVKDVKQFKALFTDDGVLDDVSAATVYRGDTLGDTVTIYGNAFPDMHREIYKVYSTGDVVVVELTLNGTQKGPLVLPMGTILPTGKVMKTPCCDVWTLKKGKIQSFVCYSIGTAMLGQLGVLGNLGESLTH